MSAAASMSEPVSAHIAVSFEMASITARQSASMRGIKKSPEHVEKIRARMIGTSYAKGRVVTEEERAARGRAVAELTTGQTFISVAAAAEHFGLVRPNLVRTLRGDGLVKRGPNAGLRFQYAEQLPTT